MDGIEEKLMLEQHEMCGNRQTYIQMNPGEIAERLSKMQSVKKEADLKYVRQDFSNAILAYNDLLRQLQALGSVPDVELMQLRTASSALQCLMKLENYEEALQMSVFALSCPSLILAPHLASKLYLMKSKVLLQFKEYEAAIMCLDRSIALEFEIQRKEAKKGASIESTVSDKNKEYRDELTESISSEREGFVAIPPIPRPLPDDELVAVCKSILQLSAPALLNVNVTSTAPLIEAVEAIKTSFDSLLASRGFLDRKVYLNQKTNEIIAITADTLVDDSTKAARQLTEVNLIQLVCSAAVNINRYCHERKMRERQMRIPAEGNEGNEGNAGNTGSGSKEPLNPDIVAPLLQLLLDKGSLATQRIADDKYSTPLHLTCWANAVECTALLIHYGALAIVTDVRGYNPLLVACSTQIVMETKDFAKGTQMYGSKDDKEEKEGEKKEGEEGENSEKGGEDAGEEKIDDVANMTTLQTNRAIIKLLVNNGASGVINHVTNEGMGATAFIAQRDDVETLTFLIQNGASINKRNFNGHSVMSCAVIGQLITTQMYGDILRDPTLQIDDGRCVSILLAYAAGMDKFNQERAQQAHSYMDEMFEDRKCAFFGSSISSFYVRMGNLLRSNMQSDGYGVSTSTTATNGGASCEGVDEQLKQCCSQLLSFAFPRLDGMQFNMPTSMQAYSTITDSLQNGGSSNNELRSEATDNPLLAFHKSITDIMPEVLSVDWQLHKPLTIGSAQHESQEIVYIPGSRVLRGQLNTASKMSPAFFPKQWIHILKKEDAIHSNYFDLGKYVSKIDTDKNASIERVFTSLFAEDLETNTEKYRAKTVFVDPTDPRIKDLTTFNSDTESKEGNAILLGNEGYVARSEAYDCFLKLLWVPVSHTFGHVIPSKEALRCLLDGNVLNMGLLDKRVQRKKKSASSLPVHKGAGLVAEYWTACLKRTAAGGGEQTEGSALVLYAAEEMEEIIFEELWLPSLLANLEGGAYSHLVVMEEAAGESGSKEFIRTIMKSSGLEMAAVESFQLPTFAYAKKVTMSVMKIEK